jgi:hypothetical protein
MKLASKYKCKTFLFQNDVASDKNREADVNDVWTSDAKKAFGDARKSVAKNIDAKERPDKIHLLKLHGSMTQKDRMETFR